MPISAPESAKILIAGGFGVGKTTFVASVSETRPLSTEAPLTDASARTDDTSQVVDKRTTTVAMDFGRISFAGIILYLFGTPGQDRFWFMWDDLVRGAIGAIVLADTRRLADCFPAVDFFEQRRVPFVVGLNQFPDSCAYRAATVRDALQLAPTVPVVSLNARDEESSRAACVALIDYRLSRTDITA